MRDMIEQPERWAVGLCLVVVLILIAIEASGLAMTLRTPAPTVNVVSNKSVAADYVGQVNNANLFGRAPAAANDQSLPQTQLQVTLRGVFTADDPALASAIIETEDGKMQIIKTGASLGADTSLERVYANRVVVVRSGVMENLYFPTTNSPTGASSAAEIATPAPAMEAPPAAATDDLPTDDDERKSNILRRLEELRARGAMSQ
jgi:general secretion pathway protein C